MSEIEHQSETPGGWEENERLLARTFDAWRAEFRQILEDHRREIRDRLEKIEREIEKKSDKENVDITHASNRAAVDRGAQGTCHDHAAVACPISHPCLW